jgi:hypothetical protein
MFLNKYYRTKYLMQKKSKRTFFLIYLWIIDGPSRLLLCSYNICMFCFLKADSSHVAIIVWPRPLRFYYLAFGVLQELKCQFKSVGQEAYRSNVVIFCCMLCFCASVKCQYLIHILISQNSSCDL